MAYRQLEAFLAKECKGIEKTTDILAALEATPRSSILFPAFCKMVRLFRRAIVPYKNEQFLRRLANYVASFANQYFASGTALLNNQQFDRFLKLFTGLNVEAPAVASDERQLIIYLSQGNFTEEWSSSLIERINS